MAILRRNQRHYLLWLLWTTTRLLLLLSSPASASPTAPLQVLVVGGQCDSAASTAQLYSLDRPDCQTANVTATRLTNMTDGRGWLRRRAMGAGVLELKGRPTAVLTGGFSQTMSTSGTTQGQPATTKKTFTNDTVALDLGTLTIRQLSSMYTDRAYHSAAVWRDTVYVCGGFNNDEKFLITCERYMSKYDRWYMLKQGMPQAKSHHTALLVGDEMLLIGGMNYASFSTPAVLKMDMYSHQFAELPDLRLARMLPLAALLDNNKVLVCGGQNPSLSYLRSCESWALGSPAWTLHNELLAGPRFGSFMLQLPTPTNRHGPTGSNASSTMILIGGGKYGPSSSLDSVTCLQWPQRTARVLRTRLTNGCHFASAILLPARDTMASTTRGTEGGGSSRQRDIRHQQTSAVPLNDARANGVVSSWLVVSCPLLTLGMALMGLLTSGGRR